MFFIHSINDYLLHWRWSRLQLEWFTPLEGGSYMYGFDLTLLGHMMRSALYIIYKETLSTPTHLAQPHPSSPIDPFVINSPIFSISLTNIQAFCIFSFSNNETWSYHSIKIKKKLKGGPLLICIYSHWVLFFFLLFLSWTMKGWNIGSFKVFLEWIWWEFWDHCGWKQSNYGVCMGKAGFDWSLVINIRHTLWGPLIFKCWSYLECWMVCWIWLFGGGKWAAII